MIIPKGFQYGAVEAAVKKPGRLDMGLLFCDGPAAVAATYTTNTVVAAPVTLCRERMGSGVGRAVVVNSGNANACTGDQGRRDAETLIGETARLLGVDPMEVFICSTGVIGAPLPVARMTGALPALVESLGDDPKGFVASILTTDSYEKVAARTLVIGGEEVRILGIAKGAGMIRPDMATMLAFIATDARIGAKPLQEILSAVVERTFNRVTVDGDTSTNDTVLCFASGRCGEVLGGKEGEASLSLFATALEEVCDALARMMVADGEGATKAVDVTVVGAASEADAKTMAFTIAQSPLVKTALHGEDPNWGRIAAALGRSGVFAGGPFDIAIGEVLLVRDGLFTGAEAEAAAHAVMTEKTFEITVTVGRGDHRATVVTSDFSAEYISINADYRT